MAFIDSANILLDSFKELDKSLQNSFSSLLSCMSSLSLCAADNCHSIYFRLLSISIGTGFEAGRLRVVASLLALLVLATLLPREIVMESSESYSFSSFPKPELPDISTPCS